jgi:hypothetical protein
MDRTAIDEPPERETFHGQMSGKIINPLLLPTFFLDPLTFALYLDLFLMFAGDGNEILHFENHHAMRIIDANE